MGPLVVAVLWMGCAVVDSEAGLYLSYDEFVRQVDLGSIKQVTIGGRGSFSGISVSGDNERPFHAFYPNGPASDPLLLERLKAHQVKVVVGSQKDEEPFPGLLGYSSLFIILLPLIALVTILAFVVHINGKLNQLLAQRDNVPPVPR